MIVCKVRGEKVTREKDVLAVEEPLEIRVASDEGTQAIAVTMRTPGEDFELAAGFLFNEGVLKSPEEIAEIKYCEDTPSPPTSSQGERRDRIQYRHSLFATGCDDQHVACPTQLLHNLVVRICGKASLEALEIQGCEPLHETLHMRSRMISGLIRNFANNNRYSTRQVGCTPQHCSAQRAS